MRLIHALCGFSLLSFLLIFSLLGINSSCLGIQPFDELVQAAAGDPIFMLRLSFVIITLTVVYLLSCGRGRRRDAHLQFKTDGGSVEVSLNAAASYLSQLKKEFAAVVSLTPKLSVRGNALRVLMKTGIKSGTRIPELSSLIQQRTRQCLSEDLGLENIEDIRIAVSEISGPPPEPKPDQPLIDMGADKDLDQELPSQ